MSEKHNLLKLNSDKEPKESTIAPPPKLNSSINLTNNLIFVCGGTEMIRFEPNGDIFIKGNLAGNDTEILDAMREFLGLNKKQN